MKTITIPRIAAKILDPAEFYVLGQIASGCLIIQDAAAVTGLTVDRINEITIKLDAFDLTTTLKAPGTRVTTAGTRLSPEWYPDEDLFLWGRENFPNLNLEHHTECFRDYWLAASKNAVKKDWNAAWRHWIRKEDNYSNVRKFPGSKISAEQRRRDNFARLNEAADRVHQRDSSG